uniref:Uncharacterized protein n=1 Tax=viral metagenome TaxID=1070528 RepID=A0A6M3LI05_9ZZZZ
MDNPTEEGKRRFSPDGIYKGEFTNEEDSDFWEVCTCSSECPNPCKGQCECKACSACYNDFLSME